MIIWILIVEAEPPKTVNGLKPFTKAIDRLLLLVTVKVDVIALAGTRFSAFVIFVGGIVLVYTPPVLLVTYTSIRQRCPANISPLVSETDVAPVGAVKTRGGAVPQPVVVGAVELLTITPAGRLSLIEKLDRFVSLGAVISILNLALPPIGMDEGENDLVATTSEPLTVTLALAASRLPIP